MEVEYVRFYQREDAAAEDMQCDSEEWPTADFINANDQLFTMPNASGTLRSLAYLGVRLGIPVVLGLVC